MIMCLVAVSMTRRYVLLSTELSGVSVNQEKLFAGDIYTSLPIPKETVFTAGRYLHQVQKYFKNLLIEMNFPCHFKPSNSIKYVPIRYSYRYLISIHRHSKHKVAKPHF